MTCYFEDIEVGMTFDTHRAVISADEVVDFASKWDPQPFHTDRQAGANSLFGRMTACGLHTLSASFRLCVDTGVFTPSGVAGLELEKVLFLAPVFPGDEIQVRFRVVTKRSSRSRTSVGIVVWDLETRNQADDLVLTMRFVNMLKKRNVSRQIAD